METPNGHFANIINSRVISILCIYKLMTQMRMIQIKEPSYDHLVWSDINCALPGKLPI